MMTAFFDYALLTWPEVAALPRTTPLCIPLGTGYDLTHIAAALGEPSRVGLLPAVPFGWRGSGLTIAEPTLGILLHNLVDSLRDDGFRAVYIVTPPGLDFGLGAGRIVAPHPSHAQPMLPLPADADRDKVVLIPIGHTEQHGHHLPLNTDTVIIDAIARGAAQLAPTQCVTLPTFPYGVSTHRTAFAGTLNVGGRAFEDFWLAVLDVLVARGFARFYLMSGHGGNCSFLVNVVKYAGERHRRIFAATAWLHTAGHLGAPAIAAHRRSAIGGMGHAGELETSLMLHLAPATVHMERVVDETDFIATPNYYMDWIEGGALIANPPWDDDTATGAYGAGSLATAEHGRLWLEAAIAEKVDHVAEIHEQHQRREARRTAGFGLWGARKST
ncbi:MAG TPA: creatininase family protein [Chloroflexi bacterium]|nr:creatininase family protein [Chloroflexota bacterium]